MPHWCLFIIISHTYLLPVDLNGSSVVNVNDDFIQLDVKADFDLLNLNFESTLQEVPKFE